ncbi:MAG TPA: hypothetical protein EYN66_09160, partial [Myxococcales bacterium]|nr:hypothetical protein [Myxococcales bacterium]
MQKISAIGMAAALGLVLYFSSSVLAARKTPEVFNLNIHFVIAPKHKDNQKKFSKFIQRSVAAAEKYYSAAPRLKIKATTRVKRKVGGRDLSNLEFADNADLASFMDTHFDHVAVTKKSGHMTVLLTEGLYFKDTQSRAGGSAYFPQWMIWGERYHGIVLVLPKKQANRKSAMILAHELGHVFGLKHSFDAYMNLDPRLNCNKKYRPLGNSGKCATCTGKVVVAKFKDKAGKRRTRRYCEKGKSNIMDYCKASKYYLNRCQRRRSALQRASYMFADGRTNYAKLKGVLGKPNCRKDRDCKKGRYCYKGIEAVGRNECRKKHKKGKACVRNANCASRRCLAFKCTASPRRKKIKSSMQPGLKIK